MYWDGSNWVDETPKPAASPSHPKRRARDWAATGLMGLVLVGLIIPTVGVFASSSTPDGAVAAWSTDYRVSTVQESSKSIAYNGHWSRILYSSYSGGSARSTDQLGAGATYTFHGTAIAWVGPTGPTRGEAKVYIDGTYVKTVDTYATSYDPSDILFVRTFDGSGTHTIKFVVQATAGHPTVALDKFIVRGDPRTSISAAVTVVVPPTEAPATTPRPTPAATATPDPNATPDPAPTSAPTPSPTPVAVSTAPPASTPAPGAVTVDSIAALKSALADDSVTDIVVADGTYHVSPASLTHADSLWIGAAYAKRTHPVIVRAETRGGVTFDGGGTTSFGCISFVEGAHDQTWDGFACANGTADQTGVVTFGGYAGKAAPHHIAMRNITIKASCKGSATSASAPATDHAFYISEAVGGPHDLTFSDITVQGAGGLATAFHFYHSDASNQNGWNIRIERLHVSGTQQAIMLWDATLHDITIDTADITGASRYAIHYEAGTDITLTHITSTGSGSSGFFSSLGGSPAGVTFLDNNLD